MLLAVSGHNIQPLTLKDCAQVARLHQAIFFKGWNEDDFLTFLKDPLIFGLKIEQSGDLCGFILWREVKEEAEIFTLCITPLFQRQGMGQILLNTVLVELRTKDIHKLFLEVAEDNEKAQNFYIKNGFILLGKRENYYKCQENGHVHALNYYKPLEPFQL